MSSQQACFLTNYNESSEHGCTSYTATCICGDYFIAVDFSGIKEKLSNHFSVTNYSDPMKLHKEPS